MIVSTKSNTYVYRYHVSKFNRGLLKEGTALHTSRAAYCAEKQITFEKITGKHSLKDTE
jgi:hypothetical protein